MKKAFVFSLAVLALLACKQQNGLQYYQTDRTYDIVSVAEPAQDAEIRNVILFIGDGMGLEHVSCAWVLNHGKLNLDNFPYTGISRT